MKQLKIKDNSRNIKDRFNEIPHLVNSIADKTLGELEKGGVFVFPEYVKETDDLSDDQMILRTINDDYCSGNVVGFLGRGDERLIIESRFSNGDNDYLFQYLLERVMNFPNLVDFETDATRDNRMFALLLFLFPSYLAAALRKGIFKTYVNRNYNDSNVRGKINVDRHIRLNTPFIGNIAYSQREYTYDNYLIQLVRHTIEFIKRKPYGNKLLIKVKDEVKQIVDATPNYAAKDLINVLIENKKNKVRHAYFHEYRALQQLCILILQNEKTQVGIGAHKTYGILFDCAWLWEEYINSLVSNAFYHPMNKSKKGSQWLFAGGIGQIYPDFIGKDSENRIIADAKYKPFANINGDDYLQVLAYMYRFDAKKAYYFYPETTDVNNKVLYLNSGLSYENSITARKDIFIIKHGLHIPSNANSYYEFISIIKDKELLFLKDIIQQ